MYCTVRRRFRARFEAVGAIRTRDAMMSSAVRTRLLRQTKAKNVRQQSRIGDFSREHGFGQS